MNKVPNQQNSEFLDDEMLDEYNFSQGVRGKYFQAYQRSKQTTLPGIQFLIDSKGRKRAAIVDLREHRVVWENCAKKIGTLNNPQFFVNAQDEQIAVFLDFEQHLEIWQAIYDAVISEMPGYRTGLTPNTSLPSQPEGLFDSFKLHWESNHAKEKMVVPSEVISV